MTDPSGIHSVTAFFFDFFAKIGTLRAQTGHKPAKVTQRYRVGFW
jgi:hypothetical protein